MKDERPPGNFYPGGWSPGEPRLRRAHLTLLFKTQRPSSPGWRAIGAGAVDEEVVAQIGAIARIDNLR